VPEDKVEALLVTLHKAQMVLRTDNGRWGLSRDLTQVTLLDLYRAGDYGLPPMRFLDKQKPAEQALGALMTDMDQDWEKRFSITLVTLFRAEEAEALASGIEKAHSL
jgi:membrane protein